MRLKRPGAGSVTALGAGCVCPSTSRINSVLWGYTRFSMPSQSSSSSLSSAPQTAACTAEVVGRVGAERAMGYPATALKSVDLPLPVAPKKPMMVCSVESSRRRLRRSRASEASSTTDSGRRSRP